MQLLSAISRRTCFLASLVGMVLIAGQAYAANFYVSSTGTSGGDGSQGNPWLSISQVNAKAFGAGDHLYFEGGKTFGGNITFDGSDGNSATDTFIVDSYGTGKATINAGTGSGIVINGGKGIAIKNLILVGAGRTTNDNANGINIKGSSISVDNCEATAFQWSGIFINGAQNIRVVRVNAHHNGYAGITSRRGASGNSNIYVGYCRANDNIGSPTYSDMGGGGQAIEFVNVNTGTIEYCEGARNAGNAGLNPGGGAGGPVGIWCCFSSNITIQHCVVHDQKTNVGHGDGGAFDFDASTSNSTLQYNYAYNNVDCGILICSLNNMPISNCVIRYNIFEDNQQGVRSYISSPITNIQIYNNTIYTSSGSCIDFSWGTGTDWYVRNNIFITKGNGAIFWGGSGTPVYQNNLYWDLDGGNMSWEGYTSLAEWRTAKGKEMDGSIPTGYFMDPMLTNPGSSGLTKPTDPTQLKQFSAYMLQPNSPCIGAGWDLNARFSVNMGGKDFFENNVPVGSSYDIGAHEFTGTSQYGCMITSLLPGAKIGQGMPITLTVSVYPASKNSSISKIEFYDGTTKLGEDATGSDGWSYVWNNAALGSHSVTAKAIDNASASSTSAVVPFTVVALRDPENPTGATNGLDYKYWEGDNGCNMSSYPTTNPSKTGIVNNFNVSQRTSASKFKFEYYGYIDVPTAGTYTFYSISNESVMAYIGTTTIISADGCHGPEEFTGTPIGLKAGKHAIKLLHYTTQTGTLLEIRWAGPGVNKQLIPDSRLFHGGSGATIIGKSALQKAMRNDVRVVGGMLEITTTLTGNHQVALYNHLGKQVGSYAMNTNRMVLPTSKIVSGMYTVRIMSVKSVFTKEVTIVR